MIELASLDADTYTAKIYSNTVAKYWSSDFLELDEMVSDESNTSKAFKAIESTLNRNIRNIAPRDHTIIRNAVISYFKNHEHFDYAVMLDSILSNYHTTDSKSEQALYRLLRFFLQKSEHAHAAAPPFQIEPSALGFDLVLGASLEVAGIYTAAIFQKSTSSVSGLSILIYSRFCLPEKQ